MINEHEGPHARFVNSGTAIGRSVNSGIVIEPPESRCLCHIATNIRTRQRFLSAL